MNIFLIYGIALRLYPVVPTNSRMAVIDTVLPLGGGPDGKSPLFIPAGRTVAWHLYTMHRRKDIYGEDAEEFKPERWETLRPGWEFLPFNGGPRICIGRKSFSHPYFTAPETPPTTGISCECLLQSTLTDNVGFHRFCRAIRAYRGFVYYCTLDAGVQGD